MGQGGGRRRGGWRDARLDVGQGGGRTDHGKKVQRPWPLRAVGVGIDVVGHAVVADLTAQVGCAVVQVMKTVCAELRMAAQATKSLLLSIAAGIRSVQIDHLLVGCITVVVDLPNTQPLIGACMRA